MKYTFNQILKKLKLDQFSRRVKISNLIKIRAALRKEKPEGIFFDIEETKSGFKCVRFEQSVS